MPSIDEVLDLDRVDPDTFRSGVIPSEVTRTFGGQVASQALISAARTVAPGFATHSLHAYFLRPGNPVEPTLYRVDRIRDGGSFCTRQTTGFQSGKPIFTLVASFHRGDEGFSHQVTMPAVPHPEAIDNTDGSGRDACLQIGWTGIAAGCRARRPPARRGRRPVSGYGCGTATVSRTTVSITMRR